MASKRILKYAFSILKQPAGHSSIEKTVFSIENLYAYVDRIYIYTSLFVYLYICYHFENITNTITCYYLHGIQTKPTLKYAFSILRQPVRPSSIENTVFRIENIYANSSSLLVISICSEVNDTCSMLKDRPVMPV